MVWYPGDPLSPNNCHHLLIVLQCEEFFVGLSSYGEQSWF